MKTAELLVKQFSTCYEKEKVNVNLARSVNFNLTPAL